MDTVTSGASDLGMMPLKSSLDMWRMTELQRAPKPAVFSSPPILVWWPHIKEIYVEHLDRHGS
jgi:hypothetical protein